MRTSITRSIVTLSLLLLVAACSSGGGAAPTVSDAWVRPPMGAGAPAAGYLTIVGGETADALLSASSPVAMTLEIHETAPDASGMMAMHPVDRIDVPAGATVALEPGGYHLMLMGVMDMPAVGETVEIVLTFEAAGEIKVQAEVRAG